MFKYNVRIYNILVKRRNFRNVNLGTYTKMCSQSIVRALYEIRITKNVQ
jgi:hypothetical protein